MAFRGPFPFIVESAARRDQASRLAPLLRKVFSDRLLETGGGMVQKGTLRADKSAAAWFTPCEQGRFITAKGR